jgi:F-type H+-transporting ATPase subunit b
MERDEKMAPLGIWRLLAVLAATVALPGLALAAEAGGGGMPQLRFGDPILIAQVVWLLIIFGLLYYVLSTYALPRVGDVLEARRARIEGDLEAARTAKAEADAAVAAHLAATAAARAEGQAAIAAAMQAATKDAQARSEVLARSLAEKIEAAEVSIAAARDAAMGALRQVSTETAEALLVRLTGQADPTRVGAAVDRALAARSAG